MADLFEDYKTRVCAEWLNMVDWAVSDALGQPQSPSEVLINIGAKPDSPQDGGYYVAQDDSWVEIIPDNTAMPAYVRTRAAYTQQAGEDTFEIPGADPRYVDVVLNGSLLLAEADYILGTDSIVLIDPLASDSDTVTVTAWGVVGTTAFPAGGTLIDYGVAEQSFTGSGPLLVDISSGQSVQLTLTGDATSFAVLNPSAHAATSFSLLLVTGGFDVTNWSGIAGWFGVVPDLSSGGTHGFGFELVAGNWYGTHKGQVV